MNEQENLLEIPDLLERSFQEIKKRFLPFFVLAVSTPVVGWLIQGIFMGFDPIQRMEPPAIWASLTSSILIGLISAWFGIALILFICKHTQTVAESFSVALRRLPRFVGGMLLYMLCILVGFCLTIAISLGILYVLNSFPVVAGLLVAVWVLFFFIVFFAIAIYWIFTPYLFVLSDWSYLNCFMMSYRMIKGHFWHTVGLLFLLFLIAMFVSFVGILAVGFLGVIGYILLPATRYVMLLLWCLPAALLTLVYQVPLLALYLDLSPTVIDTLQNKE